MNYAVAMGFLSWTLTFWLGLGYFYIKEIGKELNNPKSKLDDTGKMNLEMLIEDFNERKWAGRVILTLFLGIKVFAMPFKIARKED